AHPDLADWVHHVLALRDQNIDLPQLRDDLFRLVSLPCHCSPPGCQRHTSSRTTSMGVNQWMHALYSALSSVHMQPSIPQIDLAPTQGAEFASPKSMSIRQ